MRDYYEVLGVSRTATIEEIRRSYRKKARELHPDYAGVQSEEAFKELSVAYETLSDPEKRQMYDLRGPAGMSGASSPFGPGFGFTDIFEAMFSGGAFGGAQPSRTRGRPGRDTKVAVEVTLEDVVFGTEKQVVLDTAMVCATCEGSCCAPGTSPVTCSVCSGTGSVTRIQSSLLGQIRMAVPCNSCGGQGRTIPTPCAACAGEGRVRATRTISVTVPSGIENGSRIKLRDQGEAGAQGGSAGDLYVEVRVKPDKLFSRRGMDLHTSITVPMTTAALGVVFPLATFDGEHDVVVPPGTQPNEEVVLKGLGITRPGGTGRGNLYVHVGVEIPERLDDRSRELLEELAAHRGEDVGERPKAKSSVFGRIKDALAG